MNIEELKKYLENFMIKEEIIDEFLEDKKIIERNMNLYLSRSDFEKNEVFQDSLIFIKLEKLLPSEYLLSFIKNNSKVLNVKNIKRASDFTYGKNLKQESFSNANNLIVDKFYIVSFDEKIIGIGNFFNKQLNNIMNVGEFLKE
jgi:hypothetical protein